MLLKNSYELKAMTKLMLSTFTPLARTLVETRDGCDKEAVASKIDHVCFAPYY